MLFNTKNYEEKQALSVTTSKRQNFRKEIRRNSLMVKFEAIRAKLVEQLQSSTLQSTIQSLNQHFDQKEFRQMIKVLEGNCDSFEFNQNIAKFRLQQMLIDILLKNSTHLNIQQSTQIISALTYLTYYSSNSIESFVANDPFMDYLRIALQKLDISTEESVSFFIQVMSLLMNVASELKFDFNLFLAESDICNIIINQLNNTVRFCKNGSQSYRQLVHQARKKSLRLFFNIVKVAEVKACQQIAKLVGDVLRDEQNLNNHKYHTFLLLGQAMKNDSFWRLFLQDRDIYNFCLIIAYAIDTIQDRCFQKQFLDHKQNRLTEDQTLNFYAVIYFMNQLDRSHHSQGLQISWLQMVENVLNGYMLGQFLIEAHEKQQKENIIQALKMYMKLSNTYEVTGEQLIIVRPADDPLQLLKTFTDRSLLLSPRTGVYCLQILYNLLKKESKYLPSVMQFRILDHIGQILANEGCKITKQLIQGSIELSIQLVLSERVLGQKKIMVNIMQNKGIVKSIEQLYDHPNRDLYTKAQKFNELIREEQRK